jgi:hypothetical protein
LYVRVLVLILVKPAVADGGFGAQRMLPEMACPEAKVQSPLGPNGHRIKRMGFGVADRKFTTCHRT